MLSSALYRFKIQFNRERFGMIRWLVPFLFKMAIDTALFSLSLNSLLLPNWFSYYFFLALISPWAFQYRTEYLKFSAHSNTLYDKLKKKKKKRFSLLFFSFSFSCSMETWQFSLSLSLSIYFCCFQPRKQKTSKSLSFSANAKLVEKK